MLKCAYIHTLLFVLRTVQGGEQELSQYIVASILVGPKHHYFIQQLPPIDQYYNPQSRQSHHPAPYFPVQHEANRGFHLNYTSRFFLWELLNSIRSSSLFWDTHQKYPRATKIVRSGFFFFGHLNQDNGFTWIGH